MSRNQLALILAGGVLLGLTAFLIVDRSRSEAPVAAAPTSTPRVAATTRPVTTITTSTSVLATTATSMPRGTLVIHGTGDVAVDPSYIPALVSAGWDHAWSGLDGLFLGDDLTVINLECVPSDLGTPLDKAFTFRCPTLALPSLQANGIEVANMGNNHSGDFGKDALVDGRGQLLANGVAPVGAGKDRDEAGSPALFEIEGWTIAVVGFGGVAPSESWYATDDRPGMRSGDHVEGMVESVSAAAELADIVIVTIHWGFELEEQPRQEEIERATAMIDAGADIIFGHHQHRLNPLEFINGVPVFWGLGNFVWPRISTASATTAVARVVVSPDGSIDACLIPAFIETHGHPVLQGEPECGTGS